MRIRMIQLVLLFLVGAMPTVAQQTDRKAEKEKRRMEKEQEIAALIDAKTFVFKATRAIPTGFKSMDLTTNPNFVKFSPELIVSEMPYFGRAYSVSYGGDAGSKFEGKPEVYTVEKKKKGYSLEARVKSSNDYFTIHLSVGFEGGSSMSISSNNRSSISYNGEIFPQEKPKE
jgi:hypothetical protein